MVLFSKKGINPEPIMVFVEKLTIKYQLGKYKTLPWEAQFYTPTHVTQTVSYNPNRKNAIISLSDDKIEI